MAKRKKPATYKRCAAKCHGADQRSRPFPGEVPAEYSSERLGPDGLPLYREITLCSYCDAVTAHPFDGSAPRCIGERHPGTGVTTWFKPRAL